MSSQPSAPDTGKSSTFSPLGPASASAIDEQVRRPSMVERVASTLSANIMRKSSFGLGNGANAGGNGNGIGLERVSTGDFLAGLQGVVTSSSTPVSSSSTTATALDAFSMKPEDYELVQVIGQGSSAIVYLAIYKVTGIKVSIKVIDLDMFERNQIDELRRELQIMTLSRHPNLLPVYGSFVNGSKLFIVTPFLSGGSGLDIMKTAYQRGMEETIIATILKQVLQGLEYLHSHGLIHRDIKAGNLLVGDGGVCQLADFGVSSSLNEQGRRGTSRKTFVGTPCWMAPEVMDQSGYDYKADIWSFGITALELANGHAPYAKYPPMKVLMLTLQNQPPTLDREATLHKYSKAFKDMIDACLQKDPAKRPSAEKLLQHPFFKVAKKPVYLTTSLLNGLTPITERSHLQKGNLDTVRSAASDQNEEWDFDETSADVVSSAVSAVRFAPAPLPPPQQERSESDTIGRQPSSEQEAEDGASVNSRSVRFGGLVDEPGESGTLMRGSDIMMTGPASLPPSRSSTATAGTGDHRFSVSSSDGGGGMTGSASSVSAPPVAVRKSRFTVDNQQPAGAPNGAPALRADSTLSTTSSNPVTTSMSATEGQQIQQQLQAAQQLGVPNVGGGAGTSSIGSTSPLLNGTGAGQQHVKKGRFSVNSVVDPAASATTIVPPAMTLPPSASTPTTSVGENGTGGGEGGNQQAGQASVDTGVSTVERKAGRFAFSNLPTSAVTSPVLSATEGPKVPRKFTIVSENTGVANAGGNASSANIGSGSASGVVGAGSTTTPVTGTGSPSRSSITEKEGKKGSRFQVVGAPATDSTSSNSELVQQQQLAVQTALSLLSLPIPTVSAIVSSTPDSQNEGVSALVKMIESQRSVISDLLAIVNKGSGGVLGPIRSMSAESGVGSSSETPQIAPSQQQQQ